MFFATNEAILEMLKSIYWHSFNDKKWHICLQVVELLGKKSGFFEKPRLPEVMRLSDMTEEQLRDFMEALEKLDPELKNPPPPDPI